MPRVNYLNLWKKNLLHFDKPRENSLISFHENFCEMETRITQKNYNQEIFRDCFSLLQKFFHSGGKIAELDQYPILVEFILDAGFLLMDLGAQKSTKEKSLFWLGAFYEIKWPERKSDASFYQLLVKFLKIILKTSYKFSASLKEKIQKILMKKAPACFLQHEFFILNDMKGREA